MCACMYFHIIMLYNTVCVTLWLRITYTWHIIVSICIYIYCMVSIKRLRMLLAGASLMTFVEISLVLDYFSWNVSSLD